MSVHKMQHAGGPCGPLSAQGTGKPPGSESLCPVEPGPGVHDLYLFQGDDVRLSFRWESPPGTPAADLTGAAISMQIRDGPASTHPTVLIQASVGDGITITDGPNASFEVLFTSAKTVLLVGSDPFFYDLQVTPVGGDITTILKGRVFYDLQVTL